MPFAAIDGAWRSILDARTVTPVWCRIIVPLSYFVERPFQNWTHESAKLIGVRRHAAIWRPLQLHCQFECVAVLGE